MGKKKEMVSSLGRNLIKHKQRGLSSHSLQSQVCFEKQIQLF
jgi:hypothetical protein